MTAPLPPDPAGVLTRLEELHQAATPGPWIADSHELYKSWPGIPDMAGDWIGETCDVDDLAQSNANAAAIVAEHNAMPALLAAVRGVLALCNKPFVKDVSVRDLRAAVAAALGETGGGQ